MKYKKVIKWSLIIVMAILLSAFLLIPMGLQDRTCSSYTFKVNNDPEVVFEELNNMQNVEKWLINKETPNSYTVTLTEAVRPSFKRINLQSMLGEVQTIIKTVSKSEDNDNSVKDLEFEILHNRHGYTRTLNFSLFPDGNIIATTGENVSTAALSATYWIDFTKAGFFEKLFGKWAIILVGQNHTDEDLIQMCEKLKLAIEDSRGRMLDDR